MKIPSFVNSGVELEPTNSISKEGGSLLYGKTATTINPTIAIEVPVDKYQQALNNETQQRILADANTNTLLIKEQQDRRAADISLGQRIDQEIQDRQTADTLLDQKIQSNNDQVYVDIQAVNNTVATALTANRDYVDQEIAPVNTSLVNLSLAVDELTVRVGDYNEIPGQVTDLQNDYQTLSDDFDGHQSAFNAFKANTETDILGIETEIEGLQLSLVNLQTTVDDNLASSNSQFTTVTTNHTALSQRVDTLTALVNGNYADLDARWTTYADEIQAISEYQITLRTDFENNKATVDQRFTAMSNADEANAQAVLNLKAEVDNNFALFAEQIETVADDNSALTTRLSTLEASVVSDVDILTARIENEELVRASEISAEASARQALSTTVGGHTASIETYGESIDGLSAQYTVKVTTGGYVSGYGLASTEVDGVPTSTFKIMADKFIIGSPGAPDATPFVISTVGGVTKLALRGDMIVDGSIDASSLNVTELSSLSSKLGTIFGGIITLDQSTSEGWSYIRSGNNKWWGDGNNGFFLGKNVVEGSTWIEFKAGNSRIHMVDNPATGASESYINFGGALSMSGDGSMVFGAHEAINTPNLVGNSVTNHVSYFGGSYDQEVYVNCPYGGQLTVMAVKSGGYTAPVSGSLGERAGTATVLNIQLLVNGTAMVNKDVASFSIPDGNSGGDTGATRYGRFVPDRFVVWSGWVSGSGIPIRIFTSGESPSNLAIVAFVAQK